MALLALSLVLPLALYVGLASRLIQAHVGYRYDEALYVESADLLLRYRIAQPGDVAVAARAAGPVLPWRGSSRYPRRGDPARPGRN